MKKNFIKVSVMCALTLASTSAMVSCSDYDDDIKNHQEQIDALKKQLEASKSEITESLNATINALKTEVDAIAGSKADAATVKALEQKAAELQNALDTKASKEDVANLSNEVKQLIADVDKELKASMEENKVELQSKIDVLSKQQEELNKKIESIVGQGGDTSGIQDQLNKVSKDLADALNQLKTIEDAKYGEKIADLSTKVAQLAGLEEKVNGYTDEEIKKLDASLTGKITTAIEEVKALVPSDLQGTLTSLQNKFNDYVSKNDPQFQAIVAFMGDLSVFQGQTLKAVLDGKANANDLTSVSGKVTEIEKKLAEGGAVDQEIAQLRTDVMKMLGVMVQSIMYVPQYSIDNAGTATEKPIQFSKLYVLPENSTNMNQRKEVAENITSQVQFRVTPISAAKDFNKNYDIKFEGKQVTRAALPNYLEAEYVANAENEAKGIVTYNVKRSGAFEENGTYVLCAHINAKAAEGEKKTENMTDISSDFFLASHKPVTINKIEVTAPSLTSGEHTLAWNDGEKSYDLGTGAKLVGKYQTNIVDNDLVATFGNVFKVTYAMNKGGNSPFSIDPTKGIVKIKNTGASSAVDQVDNAKATVTPNGTNYNYGTTFQHTFKVVKDVKKYEGQNITVNWADVALGTKVKELELSPIANEFGMSINDLKNIINNASGRTDNAVDLGFVTINYTNGITITINQHANITAEKTLTINLKDAGTSTTTQAASEYQINVKIGPTIYPELSLTRQPAVWDKDVVVATPTFGTDNSGKITSMSLGMDVTTIYKNYEQDKTKIHDNHARVEISVPSTSGVVGVNYNSQLSSSKKDLVINQSQYNGAPIQATTKILFDNGKEAKTETFTFGVSSLAGSFSYPATGSTFTMQSKAEKKKPSGFSWKDLRDRKIWVDGVKQFAPNVQNAAFGKDPFGSAIYAMTAPTFEIIQDNAYLKVDALSGEITFTQAGKDKEFVGDFTATLKVSIPKPNWGTPAGLEKVQLENNKYVLTYKVVIPKGIK